MSTEGVVHITFYSRSVCSKSSLTLGVMLLYFFPQSLSVLLLVTTHYDTQSFLKGEEMNYKFTLTI